MTYLLYDRCQLLGEEVSEISTYCIWALLADALLITLCERQAT